MDYFAIDKMSICNFKIWNFADDYGVECDKCGTVLNGFISQKECDSINALRIVCNGKRKNKKAYYARPISLYNTLQEKRDIELLNLLGFEVINPNKAELEARYQKEGMSVFIEATKDCDVIAFRSFQDGKISAGVYKEIIESGKPSIELPTITSNRVLSVEDTRAYLSLLGNR